MSTEARSPEAVPQEQKVSDKELNFRAQEAKYEKILAQEKAERERLQREVEEIKRSKFAVQEEDDDDEPYVDKKRLDKKLKTFEKDIDERIEKKAEEKAHRLYERKEQEAWLDNNRDFYDVMQSHAQRFFEKAPHLAETILKMPDSFERKKLVYLNIKSLGIDKPETKQPSIQEKVDANRRSPYYQPTGVGTAPYSQAGDFSEAGKKNAYDQLKKLKEGLRLG